mmetsp:Transcript_6220/g.20824  ORF Transcript_6220/g.20824 Transcript_6220/m.20824 type:complete len:320 (+) Transcript_6220:427-1386(+)
MFSDGGLVIAEPPTPPPPPPASPPPRPLLPATPELSVFANFTCNGLCAKSSLKTLPLTFSIAFSASSYLMNLTNPYPFETCDILSRIIFTLSTSPHSSNKCFNEPSSISLGIFHTYKFECVGKLAIICCFALNDTDTGIAPPISLTIIFPFASLTATSASPTVSNRINAVVAITRQLTIFPNAPNFSRKIPSSISKGNPFTYTLSVGIDATSTPVAPIIPPCTPINPFESVLANLICNCLSFTNFPCNFSFAFTASSNFTYFTNPYPFDCFVCTSRIIVHDSTVPNFWNKVDNCRSSMSRGIDHTYKLECFGFLPLSPP